MDEQITDYKQHPNSPQEKEIILITGGSGLIGFSLIEKLVKTYIIIGLDISEPPYTPENTVFLNFDLTDIDSMRLVMNSIREDYGNKIATVVHLAAFYSFESKYNILYNRINVEGTRNLLEVLQNFQVDQFIFSSTDLLYVPVEKGTKISENSAVNATWGYPGSKVLTEELISNYDGNFKTVILRLAGIYNNTGHSIPLSHQIQRIYENRITSHFYSGNLNHGDAYVHLDDAVLAILRAIERREILKAYEVINIGEPYSPSYGTLQNTIGTLIHDKPWRTYKVPNWMAKIGALFMNLTKDRFIKPWMIPQAGEHYELDISKAKKLLDWEPKHTLLKTLPIMIHNLMQDPDKWYEENDLK